MAESNQQESSRTTAGVKVVAVGDDRAVLQVGSAMNVASIEVNHGLTFMRFNVAGPVLLDRAIDFVNGMLELVVAGDAIDTRARHIQETHRDKVSKRHGRL